MKQKWWKKKINDKKGIKKMMKVNKSKWWKKKKQTDESE